MFNHWSEFYLVAGSAAAVLIGLMFVVISLTQDRSRDSVLHGSRLYMGPVVLAMSFVLGLSAAALVPGIDGRAFGAVTALVAIWGTVRGIGSTLGIRRLMREEPMHWTDIWFYGVAPSVLYLALGVVAAGFWSGCEWAPYGLAGIVTGLLMLCVRNEWDLVTWLAPRARRERSDDG